MRCDVMKMYCYIFFFASVCVASIENERKIANAYIIKCVDRWVAIRREGEEKKKKKNGKKNERSEETSSSTHIIMFKRNVLREKMEWLRHNLRTAKHIHNPSWVNFWIYLDKSHKNEFSTYYLYIKIKCWNIVRMALNKRHHDPWRRMNWKMPISCIFLLLAYSSLFYSFGLSLYLSMCVCVSVCHFFTSFCQDCALILICWFGCLWIILLTYNRYVLKR